MRVPRPRRSGGSALLLTAALMAGPACADERGQGGSALAPAAEPEVIRFAGEVTRGKSFEKKLWRDLRFILKATDAGWEISVISAPDAQSDYAWVVTPPYRFDNPRYVEAGYRHSAAGAATWTPRRFSFVVDRADYVKAADAVRKLLWPAGIPAAEIGSAERTLSQAPKANGLLKIKRATTSGEGGGTRIESLAFEVEIRPPIVLREVLRAKFLRMFPEYETVEEACPGAEAPITVAKASYHDFDDDGFDEAVVLGYSCIAGTGGADLLGVFTRTESGEVVELDVADVASASESETIHRGLRGKVGLKVLNGRLVEEYPIYRDKDPNCCPSGGVRRFSFRWDGKAFVVDKVEDIAAEQDR